MKKPSDNFIIGTLVPATAIAAILFSIVTMVAFRLGQMTVGFFLSLLSIVAWVALLVEFFKFTKRSMPLSPSSFPQSPHY